jgi:hypothetical protein
LYSRRKKEEGRRKKEERRRKKEEAVIAMVSAVKNVLTVLAVAIYGESLDLTQDQASTVCPAAVAKKLSSSIYSGSQAW